MTRSEWRVGKIQVILKSIERVNSYLNSYESTLHRNIKKSNERRLQKLQQELERITTKGEWTNTDEFTYNNLYASQPFDINRISAL